MRNLKIIYVISILFIASIRNLFGQVSIANNIAGGTNFVGWNNTVTVPLRIEHQATFSSGTVDPSIQFWITGTKYMWIDGNSKNVAIGNTINVNPPWKLTVENDIDVECSGAAPPTNGYRYKGELILCEPTTDNLLCGWYAGSNISFGHENVLVGYQSGNHLTYSSANTCLGTFSGYYNNGDQNTFTGAYSGYGNGDGFYNTFSGAYCGNSNYDGNYNSFFGAYAGQVNYSSSNNTFIGFSSGNSNETGDKNVFVGSNSGYYNYDASNNTFAGFESGFNNISGTRNAFYGMHSGFNNTASDNTFIGFESGFSNVSGTRNTFTGTESGRVTTSSDNTFNGYNSGLANTSGTRNSFMGVKSGVANITGVDNSILGFESGYSNVSGNYNTFMGSYSGHTNTASNNSFYGYYSGYNNTLGHENVFMGYFSGSGNTTGYANVFIGNSAGLVNTTGYENTFIGALSGTSNIAGYNNTFCGNAAGSSNISGLRNSFIGSGAGLGNTTGSNNCYFGNFTARILATGNQNTILGAYAAEIATSSSDNSILGYRAMNQMTGGQRNTVMGSLAGYTFETGDDNVFAGFQSGYSNASGNLNTFLGENSGYFNTTGSHNTYIGENSGESSAGSHTLDNSCAIGANAIVRNTNHMILGDSSVKVGIGLSDDPTGPRDKLEIKTSTTANSGVSGLQFYNVTSTYTCPSTASKFLTVDVDGKVILRDAPGGGGSVNACSAVSSASDIGFIARWSAVTPSKEICKSQIYDNGTEVGVNYGSSPPSGIKFSVNGDVNIAANKSYDIHDLPFLKTNLAESDVELGYYAGPSGANNCQFSIFIGNGAGHALNATETYNVFVGNNTGLHTRYSSSSDEGSRNTYIGNAAGEGTATGTGYGYGSNNVFVGHNAGGHDSHLHEYEQNTVIGSEAGNLITDIGEHNTLIGYGSHVGNAGATQVDNAVAIGYGARSEQTNAFVCGVDANRILMGFNAVSAPAVVVVGTTTYTSSDIKLYVNPRTGSSDAAYFNGNVFVTGSVWAASDSALKQNVEELADSTASELLNQIEPKSYSFTQNPAVGINLPTGQQYGVIAEEVENVLPGLVRVTTAPAKKDSLGNLLSPEYTFKSVNYTGFIPLLISQSKKQQHNADSLSTVITQLNNRLTQLELLVNSCCGAIHPRMSSPSIDVEILNSIILNQNDPNPFAEETRITFNIPEGVENAKIIFFDNFNNIIQTVKISERGEGQLHVYASNLTSGIYNYSLIADGKVIDTKKMVCTK